MIFSATKSLFVAFFLALNEENSTKIYDLLEGNSFVIFLFQALRFFTQLFLRIFQFSSLSISFIARLFRRIIFVHWLAGCDLLKRWMSVCRLKGRQDKSLTIVKFIACLQTVTCRLEETKQSRWGFICQRRNNNLGNILK